MSTKYPEIQSEVINAAHILLADRHGDRWDNKLMDVLFQAAVINVSGSLSESTDPRIFGSPLLIQELVRLCYLWEASDHFRTAQMLTVPPCA